MKTTAILTTAIVLILATGALAADIPPTSAPTPPSILKAYQQTLSGISVLKIDPLLEEIHWILLARITREEALLVELSQAGTGLESDRIMREIQQLDVDQELDILQVQMRYARINGRYDREREIRAEIVALLSGNALALP
jgi:hypothetical protein